MKGRNSLGSPITPRRSRRVGPVVLTDFDFADDIALVSESVTTAQALFLKVEGECQKVGLMFNAKKTEVMTFNIEGDVRISTIDGSVLEVKDDFFKRYLKVPCFLHQLHRKRHPNQEGAGLESTSRPQENLDLVSGVS